MSWFGAGTPASQPPSSQPAENDLSPKTVFYLGILRVQEGKPAVELAVDTDLSSFNMFSRKQYREFIEFTTKTVAERTKPGSRNTVEEKIAQVNAYRTSQGFCIVMLTDPNYKPMAAQAFLSKVADSFQSSFTPTEIKEKQPPFQWPQIETLRLQAVTAERDGIAAVQQTLDETKVVLHQTIQSVLERGEKLDALVAKSDELSGLSKGFYKQAKQQNACCVVM